MKMKIETQGLQILLSESLISCTCFTGIFLFLHFSDSIYSVGKYKFLPIILAVIILVEYAKVLLPTLKPDQLPTVKPEQNHSTRTKKSVTKAKDFFKLTTAAAVITFIYFAVIVLFGAPLLTHHEETLMLALTLTTLTLIPATCHLGIDNTLILFTGSQSLPSGILLDAITLNIKAVLLGTWCSAFVIPLDWDRPWQAWPIPCIVGALLGCFAANFVTLVKILLLKIKKKRK